MQLSIKFLATTISVAALLSACATPQLEPTEHESFATKIHADDSKTFTYQLEDHGAAKTQTYIEFTDQRLQDSQHPNAQQEADQREEQRREHRFFRLLDAKLKQTGFCREGYVELESSIKARVATVRGECRESASPEDRERFSGPATQ